MSAPHNVTRILAMFALTASLCLGQFGSGIQGTVTDSAGARVPDAEVHLTNMATGVSRTLTTTSAGFYRVLNLGAGEYRIEVRKEGFRPAVRENITLGINETTRVNFSLELGAVSEQITVSGNATEVETEEGRVSGQIESSQINRVPLNGRNVFNLIALQPGVTGRGLSSSFGVGGGANDAFAGEAAPQINASGQRSDANMYSIDGTSVNSSVRPGIANITPNADSVQEVRVVANNFSAEEGRNTGAHVQVISKNGTNSFHGGASYYLANNTLSSRNIFEDDVAPFRRHDFTYNIGGPIIKNRLFFFHSYEGLRSAGSRAQTYVVETPQFRNFVTATRPNTIASKVFSQFQPAADPTFNFIDLGSPAPGLNVYGPKDGIPDIGSVNLAPARIRDGNQFNGRIDYEMRPGKDRLYGMFYRTDTHTLNGGVRPDFDQPTDESTTFVNLTETHIFNPSVLNEFRAGVSRLRGQPADPPYPQIPLLGVAQISTFSTSSYPSGWFQTNFDYRDVLSIVKSSHTIKIGGEIRRIWINSRNTSNLIPQYRFLSILDFADDEAERMIRNVDPRTGDPATNVVGIREFEWAAFINDDWKVTRNFTMNFGLRYENFGTKKEVNGLMRQFEYGSGKSLAERVANGSVGIVERSHNPDNNNFAPRFGFAWDPSGNGTTAIRGGYGISYDRLLTNLNIRGLAPLRAVATLGPRFGTDFTYALGDPTKPFLGYPVDDALRLGLDERGGIVGARVSLSNLATIDDNIRNSYVHNWFFGIQREIGLGVIADVSYLGSAGHKLYHHVNVNRYAGDLLDNRFDGFNPSFQDIHIIQSSANSIYHGGTVTLKRRFMNGFSLQGAYTFGKAITDSEDVRSSGTHVDLANLSLDRGLASFDAPQKLAIIGVWDLPFLRKQDSLASRVFGGWTLSGFGILQKGTPFTVSNSVAWPRGDYNADGQEGDRPNAPADSIARTGFSRAQFLSGIFRPSNFPVPTPGTNGTLGRNTFRGPGYFQIDMSISKDFAISERVRGRLILDAFNALNRVNLNDPVGDLNSGNFGRSTSASTPRVFQVGAKITF